MRRIFTILGCILFAATTSKFVQAQSQWHFFSPPDKGFTVELSNSPQRAVLKEDEAFFFESIFDNIKSGYAYNFSLQPNDPVPDFYFGVVYLTSPISNRRFDETVNSNMLWIGGDDKHFSKEENVVVNGLHGREFIYKKGNASGRSLFVNSGRQIFFLLVHTEEEGVVSSEPVARVFRTFRPTPRVNRTKS